MILEDLFRTFIDVLLEALPFLAFGFLIAGLLKSFVSNDIIAKHLGKEGWISPIKSALLGAPLPLCSCSVIPVAAGLRRSGAGKGTLTSFLISAPETGVDSLSISYAMLGPVMVLARLISALITAIVTAWAVMLGTANQSLKDMVEKKSCCASNTIPQDRVQKKSVISRFIAGQRYAFTTLLDDSFTWVLLALIVTAALKTYVPATLLVGFGDSIWTMILIVVIGFPMYICASASIPVAVGLLAIGISPGAALVFMLAGPASNIATIGVVKNLMGWRAAMIYVISVCGCSVLAGLGLNALIGIYEWDILSHISQEEIIPLPIAIVVSVFVLLAAVKPLRPYIGLSARPQKAGLQTDEI